MAKQFIYPGANPIKLTQIVDFNPLYNNLPFDYQKPKLLYTQKYKTGNVVKLQCLSDWLPSLLIYDFDSKLLVDTIAPATPVTSIVMQTFTCYEFQIVWNDYGPGDYYIEIQYTDDDALLEVWESEVIQIADTWPQTLQIEYCNSYNAFSVLFSTGITFVLCVEGNIEDFTPAFEDIIYNDQEYNTTKLNAIPRREFNLYVASNRGFTGIPAWMGDKVNWALACDQIKIDGVYYQNTSGSKWEVKRTDPDGTNFIGLRITIIEVINLFLQTYQPGYLPAGSIQVITRCLKYLNNSANITIPGIFTDYSVLTKIIIYNLGGDVFTITAGTAADGSQPIDSPFTLSGITKEIWEINEPFDAVSTLYLQGFVGTNCNVFVEYDQLDAPTITPIVSTKKFSKGTLYMYEEVTVGDFEIHFNIGTGAGNPDTDYEGCVISGTNGTLDRNGLLATGWDSTQPLTRDTLIGVSNNTVALSTSNLPTFTIPLGQDLKSGSSGVPVLSSQNPGPNGHGTFNATFTGANVPFSIANRARITVYFVCITN